MAEFSWSLEPATTEPDPNIARRGRALGDVRLYNTPDGGEIEFINGQLTRSDGLETAVYLSLFGGNERDSGNEADDPLQWWGNLSEQEESRRYRSETQNLLRSIPATTGNLLRIEDAVTRDLDWMTSSIASFVGAAVSIPAINSIRIDVQIQVDDRRYDFVFTEAWRVRNSQ